MKKYLMIFLFMLSGCDRTDTNSIIFLEKHSETLEAALEKCSNGLLDSSSETCMNAIYVSSCTSFKKSGEGDSMDAAMSKIACR